MENQKGFTLIETLVGLAILGLLGIILLSSLAMSARSTMTNDKLSKAESLARAQLEYIQSQPYNASNSYLVLSIPSNYSGFSYATPMVTSLDNGLQKITVTVNSSNTTTFTLMDYKVNK